MSINISSTPFTLPTTVQLPPTPVNSVVASTYSFASSDAQTCTMFNSTAIQVATIAAGIAPVGSQLMTLQFGTGSLKINAGAGVTLLPASTANSAGQYAVIGLLQAQTNTWITFGASL